MKTLSFLFICMCLSAGIALTPASLANGNGFRATLRPVSHLRLVTTTSTNITMTWKKQASAKRYQVRVFTESGQLFKTKVTKKRRIVVGHLQADTVYRVKVRAVSGKKPNRTFGRYSKKVTVRTAPVVVENDSADTDPIESDQSNEEITDDPAIVDEGGSAGEETPAEETPEEPVEEVPPTEEEVPPVEEPAPTPAPVLIGFWGLNGYLSTEGLADVQTRFHSTVFQIASGAPGYTVNTFLPLVRASGMKVTLRLSGNHPVYTTDGNFDLAKWKAAMDVWTGSGVQAYIDDGTLVGHMLLDDIDTFAGADPTAADLDEMARYSEELLPGLMTYVRQKCSRMPTPATEDGHYVFLDNCVNQYTNYPGYSDGPIADYVVEQTAAAASRGLGMINGLNIADGGDGSSGHSGWGAGKYAMSAAEITTYGAALLAVPNLQMFLMWEYDGQELWSDGVTIGSDYFDQPDIQAALAGLVD